MFIYLAIKHDKELWRVEDRARSERLKNVGAEATMKTVRERIRLNLLGNRRSCPESWTYRPNNVVPHQGWSTYERAFRSKGHLTPALKEIQRSRAKRLLQWHAENGHENILFTEEKIFTIDEQYNSQDNKIYAQTSLEVCSEGARMPSPFLRHGLVGCPIRGWHLFIFARKVWKLVPECMNRKCYKELWNLLPRLSLMVRNGSSSRTHPLTTRPRHLRSGCGGTFRPLSTPRIGPRGVQTSTPRDHKLWVVLEDMACPKRHKNLDSLKRSLVKAAAEIPLETVRAARAEWPEGLKVCVGAEGGLLSDIIINKILKLLLMNYLARKVDVLFHFPSRSQYIWDMNLWQDCVEYNV